METIVNVLRRIIVWSISFVLNNLSYVSFLPNRGIPPPSNTFDHHPVEKSLNDDCGDALIANQCDRHHSNIVMMDVYHVGLA
jgi:hypothetical protein